MLALRRAVQAAAAGGVHAWVSPARGAGHSKWANIKHAKSLQDQKRSATFLKILREIKTAVRVGGTNLDSNHRLATAVQNARQLNVPKVKIQNAMLPNSGAESSEMIFEVKAPGGAALIIEAEGDSRASVIPAIRRVLARYNCTLGSAGSASWMFDRKGVIHVDITPESAKLLADPIEVAIEAGAEEAETDEDSKVVTFICAAADFDKVQGALEEKGLNPSYAEIEFIAHTHATCNEEHTEGVHKIVQKLQELEEVTSVTTNLPPG